MQKLFLTTAFMCALVLSQESAAQIVQPGSVTVSATASVEVEPDKFTVYVVFEDSSGTGAGSIEGLTGALPEFRDAMASFKGLESYEIATRSVSVQKAQINKCTTNSYSNEQFDPDCIVEEFKTVYDLSISGSPAEIGGNVVSFAIEKGANSARLGGFQVSDREAALAEANRKAVKLALDKAELLAEAAGMKLGAVEVLSDGTQPYRNNSTSESNSPPPPPPPPPRPVISDAALPIPVDPQPKTFTANVVLQVELRADNEE
ncbi:MAG: hypothetical protein CMK09_12390 [Ponticaulis sp.]|nr:hypothetical protein [Ponticaulis sp.]|tara:strand:- start:14121 stop:14903 length:783 start_codon:yes stop_codon:yes gene_type:complete